MKKRILVLAVLLAGGGSAFAGNVGVSISIDQPGLFGQLNIGNVPAPELIFRTPMMVRRPAYAVGVPAAIYLHVPPGYERHWDRHCHEYHACGRPVYFVQDRWYHRVYVPARREYEQREHDRRYGGDDGGDRRDRRDESRGYDHRDYRDHRDDHRNDRRDDHHDHRDHHGDHHGDDHGGDR